MRFSLRLNANDSQMRPLIASCPPSQTTATDASECTSSWGRVRRYGRCALCACLLWGAHTATIAQDLDDAGTSGEIYVLSQFVVTASGFSQAFVQAPASISVVSREELQEKRVNNLAEAIAEIEGVDIGASAGKTGGLNISIRGMPSDYTLILVDGRRQNTAGNVTPNGFGETSTSFLPPPPQLTASRSSAARCPRSTAPMRWGAS